MSERNRYFRIGIFIMCGIVLLVVAVIVFGGGRIFKKEILVETYFNTSVQGLDVGSPVKYRGVKIGAVKDITIVNREYPLKDVSPEPFFYKYGLYVMVIIALDEEAFAAHITPREAPAEFEKMVREKGLRLKISYLGITGLAYLELDFADPTQYKSLEIVWEPRTPYIPSVPNTMQLVTDSLDDIARSLTNDFFPMLKRLNAASEDFPMVIKKLNATLNHLKTTFERVSVASDNFPNMAAKLDETLFYINEVFKGEQQNIEDILNNTRKITEDVKEITATLKKNPSQMVFGEAPPRRAIKRQ